MDFCDPLLRHVADDCHPMAAAAYTGVVIQGVMLCTTIIPKCNGSNIPAKTAGKLRTRGVGVQILQQRSAFRICHTVKAHCVGLVHEQAFAPRLWVGADHGMHGFLARTVCCVWVHLHGTPLIALLQRAVGINGMQRGQQGLHTGR